MFCFFPENKILMAEGAGDDEAFVGYEVPKSKAVDIDNEDDWLLLKQSIEAGALTIENEVECR